MGKLSLYKSKAVKVFVSFKNLSHSEILVSSRQRDNRRQKE